MTAFANYTFVIADINGTELDSVDANNPEWSYVLNDAGGASFTLPNRDPKALHSLLTPGLSELHIYKAGITPPVWGGHLWTAEGTVEGDVRFGFKSYFEMAKHRYVDASQNFVATDQLDIAWGLINFTQSKTNGNKGMGWTRFSATASGVARDIDYPFWERSVIGQDILDISTLNNGFDFEVTPSKQWKTYYPSKGSVIGTNFVLGTNILGLSVMEDASSMINTFSAIGAGDGKNTCIAVAADGTSQLLYGLREGSESDTNIKHYAVLQDKATEGLRMNKNPRVQPDIAVSSDIAPLPYSYVVGDRINVVSNEGYLVYNKQFRIISLAVALSNSGREAITVQFDDQVSV